MKKNIPNLLTLGNLLAGCIGIDLVYQGQLNAAMYCILLGGVLDFLDGFVARLLKAPSAMGKELDSLADLVTFGVLPAFILMKLIYNGPVSFSALYLVFLIPLCSAWRLARFNTDTRQSDTFLGLPTPANAFLTGSLPLLYEAFPALSPFFDIPYLLGFILVTSALLVSGLPLIAFKFKGYGVKENIEKYLLIGLSLPLLAIWQLAALPMVIGLYILISLIFYRKLKKKTLAEPG
jgi:CDP-diacylglycerol--serine O-phosphatidyltransferase